MDNSGFIDRASAAAGAIIGLRRTYPTTAGGKPSPGALDLRTDLRRRDDAARQRERRDGVHD